MVECLITPMQHKAEMITSGEHALTREEYNLLLGACDNQEDRVMLMMAVSLGLRRGDVVKVKWSDIDFTDHTLTYYERKKDRLRTLPMAPALEQELKILFRVRPSGRKEVLPFGDRQAYNRFNRLCEGVCIARRPFHSLRSTCVKFAQSAGWSPEQVSRLTGDTIRVIQLHYATPSTGEMKEITREKSII